MRSRFALLLMLAVGPVRVAAQPTAPSSDSDRATTDYREAVALYRLGKYAEAAPLFETSYRIVKLPAILFDIAQSYRKVHESSRNVDALARAIDTYRTFLREAPKNADKRAFVEQLLPKLEQTLQDEQRRRRQELIAKAIGKEGLFIAEQLVAEGALRDAATVLDRILGARGNSHEVLVPALERRGIVAARLGQADIAHEAFRRVLVLDPGFVLGDDADPSVRLALQRARSSLGSTPPLKLSHVPIATMRVGAAPRITIAVEMDALGLVRTLAVSYRAAGAGAFSRAVAPVSAGHVALPTAFVDSLRPGQRVEYYVAALDEADGELAVIGSVKEPFIANVATPDGDLRLEAAKPPLYKRPWLWGVVGGAVVVAGIGIGLGVYFGSINNPTELPIPGAGP